MYSLDMSKNLQISILIVGAMAVASMMLAGLILHTPFYTPGIQTETKEHDTLIERVLDATITGNNTSVQVEKSDDTVSVVAAKSVKPKTEAPDYVPHLEQSILTLILGNGSMSLASLLETLKEGDAIIVEAIVHSWMERFGSDDLLKLLESPSSVQLVASGTLVDVLVAGSHGNTQSLHQTIERMQQDFAKRLPTARITTRVLDRRFTAKDIRYDPSQIRKDHLTISGWNVTRISSAKTNEELVTATIGKRFLVATDLELVERAIKKKTRLLLPGKTTWSIQTAGAVIELEAVATLLQRSFPVEAKWLQNAGTGTLLLSSRWKGGMQTTTIHLTEKAHKLLDSLW